MAPYGYFYYLLIGLGLKLFGYQFWFGRALSLIATVICLICIGRITWLLTQKRQPVFVTVLVFLSLFPVQAWIALHRPDLPALALAFVGLWLVFEVDKPSIMRISLALGVIVFCLASAFFFKQTILLPTCIVTIRCLQSGQRKIAFFLLLEIAALIALIAILLNQTSERGYYFQHFVLAQEIPYDYSTSVWMVARLIKEPSTLLFLIAAIALLFSCFNIFGPLSLRQRYRDVTKEAVFSLLRSPKLLVLLYFVMSLTLGFITSARRGSNVNYFLEASLIGSIAIALAWDSFTRRVPQKVIYGLLISLITLTSVVQLTRVVRGEYFRWQSLPYYKEIVATLKNSTDPGSVCISAYPELATFADREYHFGDWIQYNDGRSKDLGEVFWRAVASKKYHVVIWPDMTFSDSFPNYRLFLMKHPPPQKFYPVYLFVSDSAITQDISLPR